jgi:chromosome segregation ATPase
MSSPASAQEDQRAREAMKRLQAQQRELAQQKAKAEEEKQVLEQEKAKLNKLTGDQDKELKKLRGKVKTTDASVKAMEVEVKKQTDEATKLRNELEAANLKLSEQQQAIAKMDADLRTAAELSKRLVNEKETLLSRFNAQSGVVGLQSRLNQLCEEKNAMLYRIGNDLLDKYRNKGVVDAIKQAEPFTQIEKVKVENLWQEYKDALDREKLAKPVLAQ